MAWPKKKAEAPRSHPQRTQSTIQKTCRANAALPLAAALAAPVNLSILAKIHLRGASDSDSSAVFPSETIFFMLVFQSRFLNFAFQQKRKRKKHVQVMQQSQVNQAHQTTTELPARQWWCRAIFSFNLLEDMRHFVRDILGTGKRNKGKTNKKKSQVIYNIIQLHTIKYNILRIQSITIPRHSISAGLEPQNCYLPLQKSAGHIHLREFVKTQSQGIHPAWGNDMSFSSIFSEISLANIDWNSAPPSSPSCLAFSAASCKT